MGFRQSVELRARRQSARPAVQLRTSDGLPVRRRPDVAADRVGRGRRTSEEFVPAYFEDTDLAFKVREKGYTTWFIPSSVVYHFEGLSNGTDVTETSGLKRFQEINRPKFRRKWAQVFKDYGEEGKLPDLRKDRGILGRALFIDNAVPRPDRDAGSYAALQEMRLVQSLGYKVTFIPLNLAYLGHYQDELNKLGIETYIHRSAWPSMTSCAIVEASLTSSTSLATT